MAGEYKTVPLQLPSLSKNEVSALEASRRPHNYYITLVAYLLDYIIFQRRLADLIRTAILNNEFMQHLDSAQVDAIVECMVEVKCYKDDLIIKEGDEGVRVYVLSGTYLLQYNAFS